MCSFYPLMEFYVMHLTNQGVKIWSKCLFKSQMVINPSWNKVTYLLTYCNPNSQLLGRLEGTVQSSSWGVSYTYTNVSQTSFPQITTTFIYNKIARYLLKMFDWRSPEAHYKTEVLKVPAIILDYSSLSIH